MTSDTRLGTETSRREEIPPACCDSTLLEVCCSKDAKSDCCGIRAEAGCGCQTTHRETVESKA